MPKVILNINKHSTKIRQKLSDWIKGEDSTIVCLQETSIKDTIE